MVGSQESKKKKKKSQNKQKRESCGAQHLITASPMEQQSSHLFLSHPKVFPKLKTLQTPNSLPNRK
jgi:hypothetical protein